MRLKLDENLPGELARLFIEAGHDAVTVLDQEIGGATDATVLCSQMSGVNVFVLDRWEGFDFPAGFLLGKAQFVEHLQVEPKVRAGGKEMA